MDVVCLFEASGYSAAPWARAGHTVWCYDILNGCEKASDNIIKRKWDARCDRQNRDIIFKHKNSAILVLAFPPCTDLAVSGAAHFEAKRKADPFYREKAMQLVYAARDIAEAIGAPYAIENPVSVISSEWRKPDCIFHPFEYGGYLPEDDRHPDWPEYIRPRDAYPKATCYWTGGGFVVPPKKPVPVAPGYSDQQKKLGGKSAKTKAIRSASPRGMAQAIYEANKSGVQQHQMRFAS